MIARNSTFTYKGKPVKVQQVAEELGVRYVLEGSVQQSGDQLRVTAQLIDAVEGYHLWSERYDRRMEDLFALQDDITRKIVVAMQINLTEGEQARVRHRTTSDLRAWGHATKGYTLFERYAPKDNANAREQFERAVDIDADYTWAWVWLGWTHFIDARMVFVKDRAASFKRSNEIAQKALAMNDTLPDVHALLAGNYWVRRQYDEALAAGRKAIALDPNSAENHAILALITHDLGDWDQTIALSKMAVRLHPRYPSWYLFGLSRAYTFKGEYDLAVAAAEEGLRRAESNFLTGGFHSTLAFAHMEAGRKEEARRHVAERLRLPPPLSPAYIRKVFFFKNPAHLERFIAALRKAGLPE